MNPTTVAHMLRTYEISITDVDGASYHHLETDDKEYALNFVKKHDHEGASLSLRVSVFNEDVYKLLAAPAGETPEPEVVIDTQPPARGFRELYEDPEWRARYDAEMARQQPTPSETLRPHPQLQQHVRNTAEKARDVADFVVGHCSGRELQTAIACAREYGMCPHCNSNLIVKSEEKE